MDFAHQRFRPTFCDTEQTPASDQKGNYPWGQPSLVSKTAWASQGIPPEGSRGPEVIPRKTGLVFHPTRPFFGVICDFWQVQGMKFAALTLKEKPGLFALSLCVHWK